jgi:predicted exporter
MSQLTSELQMINQRLAAFIGTSDERAIITYQTAPDESVIIGSEKAIAKLAMQLLSGIIEAKTDCVHNIPVLSHDIEDDGLSDIGQYRIKRLIIADNAVSAAELKLIRLEV